MNTTTYDNPAAVATAYLSHLANERRLSPLTCASYARDIAALLELTKETPLDQLQIHHMRRFVARLHAKGLSGRSLARMLSAWRGLYHYLARDHGYTSNPCAGLRAPKTPKTLPHALSPDEAAKLLPFIDGIFNWAKHFVWSRNEFADVPASPFAIGATLPAVRLVVTTAEPLYAAMASSSHGSVA